MLGVASQNICRIPSFLVDVVLAQFILVSVHKSHERCMLHLNDLGLEYKQFLLSFKL